MDQEFSRRLLLFGILTQAPASNRAPTEPARLNPFSEEYNAYIRKLGLGIVDLKQWARVEKAWTRLTS